MMPFPVKPHKHRRDGETPSQRKRRNLMRLIHQVVEVGETVRACNIYERICIAYPHGHQAMPQSANQLGQILRGEKSMMKIEIGTNKYTWRRLE